MQKGETVISIALAAVVFFAIFAIQRRWNPTSLKEVATSAEDFILTTTGIRGQVPDIAGYERVKTFRLEGYLAGLYRATPAPLVFASGRLVIYDRQNQPVFTLETLEGSKEPWTALYDFAGRRGLPAAGNRARPDYARDLTGDGVPDAIIGQYSGGDHCCTVATIVALGTDTVTPIGRIDGLDGMPFEGLEVRKLNKDTSWECIAHRPYLTACGTHADAADVISAYAFANGRYTDQTARFDDYLLERPSPKLGEVAAGEKSQPGPSSDSGRGLRGARPAGSGETLFRVEPEPVHAQPPEAERRPECLPRKP